MHGGSTCHQNKKRLSMLTICNTGGYQVQNTTIPSVIVQFYLLLIFQYVTNVNSLYWHNNHILWRKNVYVCSSTSIMLEIQYITYNPWNLSDQPSTVWLRGLRGALNWASIMPRDASLPDSGCIFIPITPLWGGGQQTNQDCTLDVLDQCQSL